MDVIKAIKKRISVRKFKDKELDKKTLFKILDAGRLAPSAGNVQNWRFVVVDDKDKIEKVGKATLQPEVFYNVPYVVVVCSDSGKIRDEYPKRGELYAIQNVAAAIENMLLAATELEVDSMWIGAFADETVKSILEIPQEIDVHAILPFGYRDEQPNRTSRQRLAHLTSFNKWGGKAKTGFFPLSQHVEKAKKKIKGKLKRKNKGKKAKKK